MQRLAESICDHDWKQPSPVAASTEAELLELSSQLDNGHVHRTRVVSVFVVSSLDGCAPYVGYPVAAIPSCGRNNALRIGIQLGKLL